MELLFQRFWHTSVIREKSNSVIAKTSYLDSQVELDVALQVKTSNLLIEKAWLDRLSRPGERPGIRENIKSLRGVKAYLGSGAKLRQALKSLPDEVERSLFKDSVVGVVQAETFLVRDRGYADLIDYNRTWENSYVNSCHYFSNLQLRKVTWEEYMGDWGRDLNLFNRFKSQQLYRDGNNNFMIMAMLIDSFHQMSSCLLLDQEDLRVLKIEGNLLRVPDEICRGSLPELSNLKSRVFVEMPKRQLAALLGGSQGCIHLIDLIYDSGKTMELYKKNQSTTP